MADKLMYIPNKETQYYPFCRLQLVVETFVHSLNEPTNQGWINVPKNLKPTFKKTLI